MAKRDGKMYSLFYDPVEHAFQSSDCMLKEAPKQTKKNDISFRIVMGKKCNFRCSYCIQNRETTHPGLPDDDDSLVENMLRVANDRHISRVLFWGGEPLLYFREMKTLHAQLVSRLKSATGFTIVTNGSLLKGERLQWILDNRIHVSVSWDGDGQSLRGADPLADPEVAGAVRQLLEKQPERLSFNPVMTRLNPNHETYAKKLMRVIGSNEPVIAEGRPVSICDAGSLASAMPEEDMPGYARRFHRALVTGTITHMTALRRADAFIKELGGAFRAVPTVCFAASPDVFTVDLGGNLLTCQSFGTDDVDDYGDSMWLGNLASLSAGAGAPIPALTGLKLRQREHCGDCAVFRLCKGGCPYTPKRYFRTECWYNQHHYIAIFGYALHLLTGDVLTEARAA
jgi:uncharacterized protein